MKRLLITMFLIVICIMRMAGQAMQTEFGKNILQFKDFDWTYYQTPQFDVYFYEGGREPARYLVEKGPGHLKEVERALDYQFGEKISFIVYNSYSDFRQSNYFTTEESYNTGGRSVISGNKVFMYFNGDHQDFIRQIKAGFARLTLNELMGGASIQDKVQNSILLNIPDWFTNGIIRYISEDWDNALDNKLKEGVISERFRKFSKLTDEEKNIVSQSIWKYIYEQYGDYAFSNVIYNTRASRNLEEGFEYSLGKNFTHVFDEWFDFELKRFTTMKGENPASYEEIKPGKPFKRGVITRWDINTNGSKVAFVTNDLGKIKIWVSDPGKKSNKCIFKTGYHRAGQQDYAYPVIAWNPVRDELTVFYERKSQPYYFTYNANTSKKGDEQLITNADYVLDASYSQDGKFLVTSAIKNGQSDIFILDPRTQFLRPVTNDIYDDRQPRFVNNSKGIVFSSNRPNTGLNRVNSNSDYHFNYSYDIFYFPDYLARPRSLKRISRGKSGASMPDHYDSSYISYLTNENGIMNRNAAYSDSIFQYIRVVAQYKDTIHKNDTFRFYKNDKHAIYIKEGITKSTGLMRLDTDVIYRDTVYTYNITDYNENILSYKIIPRFRTIYELFRYDGHYRMFKRPTPPGITSYRKVRVNNTLSRPVFPEKKPDVTRIDITDQKEKDTLQKKIAKRIVVKAYFQTEFQDDSFLGIPLQDTASAKEKEREEYMRKVLFAKKEKRNKFAAEAEYFPSYAPDLVVTQADNSVLTSPYLPYFPGTPLVYNPTIQGTFKLGTSDLFKDYRVVGGMGIQPDLSGAQYFLSFYNLKKRMDKIFTVYRKGITQADNNGIYNRQTSIEGRAELRWPFTETLGLRGSVFARQDKLTYLANNQVTLEQPNNLTYWSGLRGELVFDNTIDRGLNLRNGSRYKVYSELFDGVNKSKTLFAVAGADFRTYTRIIRKIIWANRIAYASSFGSAKVVYFLGGADGALFPINANIPPDPKQNYVYMLSPGSLRGFNQDERNGNSFALLNSELRVPVFKSFSNRPVRSPFVENFQVTGFFDAGSAWLGFLPTGQNNAYQTNYINGNPLTVKVVTFRQPFIYGYGFGLRTMILGYFVRFDEAWGVIDGQAGNNKIYFSLGLDF